uniref:Uncharacterized protein n=1 Tax=Rhizophora mucronata TaxID=61149 RepID=A0A2P2IIC5_RHIMU
MSFEIFSDIFQSSYPAHYRHSLVLSATPYPYYASGFVIFHCITKLAPIYSNQGQSAM